MDLCNQKKVARHFPLRPATRTGLANAGFHIIIGNTIDPILVDRQG
jgi:hypothetical protein